MLGNLDVRPTLAVRDMAAARAFYEGKLGLSVIDDRLEGAVTYKAGHGELFVYQSSYAGTNQAAAASWGAGDQLDAVVAALRREGGAFEHYDLPGMRRDGDIHSGEGMRVAWFKDPDGNILALGAGG